MIERTRKTCAVQERSRLPVSALQAVEDDRGTASLFGVSNFVSMTDVNLASAAG
jgi:hypothetical protein